MGLTCVPVTSISNNYIQALTLTSPNEKVIFIGEYAAVLITRLMFTLSFLRHISVETSAMSWPDQVRQLQPDPSCHDHQQGRWEHPASHRRRRHPRRKPGDESMELFYACKAAAKITEVGSALSAVLGLILSLPGDFFLSTLPRFIHGSELSKRLIILINPINNYKIPRLRKSYQKSELIAGTWKP